MTRQPCDIRMRAGERMGRMCACGHVDMVHRGAECDVCRATSMPDILVVHVEASTSAQTIESVRDEIVSAFPELTGRVMVLQGVTSVHVVRGTDSMTRQADAP